MTQTPRRLIALAFGVGMLVWSLGLFGPAAILPYLESERGWSVAMISVAITGHFLVSALVVAAMPEIHRAIGLRGTVIAGAHRGLRGLHRVGHRSVTVLSVLRRAAQRVRPCVREFGDHQRDHQRRVRVQPRKGARHRVERDGVWRRSAPAAIDLWRTHAWLALDPRSSRRGSHRHPGLDVRRAERRVRKEWRRVDGDRYADQPECAAALAAVSLFGARLRDRDLRAGRHLFSTHQPSAPDAGHRWRDLRHDGMHRVRDRGAFRRRLEYRSGEPARRGGGELPDAGGRRVRARVCARTGGRDCRLCAVRFGLGKSAVAAAADRAAGVRRAEFYPGGFDRVRRQPDHSGIRSDDVRPALCGERRVHAALRDRIAALCRGRAHRHAPRPRSRRGLATPRSDGAWPRARPRPSR